MKCMNPYHLAFSFQHKGKSRRGLWVACGGTMDDWRGGPAVGRGEREWGAFEGEWGKEVRVLF